MVIASDRREVTFPPDRNSGSGVKRNMVPKLFIDPSGQFAWAYAGTRIARQAAKYLHKSLKNSHPQEIEEELAKCGNEAWANCAISDVPPDSETVLLTSASKNIFRASVSKESDITEFSDEGYCLAGQTYNLASLIPEMAYSKSLAVDRLIPLAAYMLYTANRVDSLMIAGADIAVYRDKDKRFTLLDNATVGRAAKHLDSGINAFFSGKHK
jgi:hypothetical protein